MDDFAYLAYQAFCSANRYSVHIGTAVYNNLAATQYWLDRVPVEQRTGSYYLTLGQLLTFEGDIKAALHCFSSAKQDQSTALHATLAIEIWQHYLTHSEPQLSSLLSGVEAIQRWESQISQPSIGHQEYDVIFVPGKKLNHRGEITLGLMSRLDSALRLARLSPTAAILVSGGVPICNFTEAGQMRHYLKMRGVKEERILLENHASNTLENAQLSIPILYQHYRDDPLRIAVVSDDDHAIRTAIALHSMSPTSKGHQPQFSIDVFGNNITSVSANGLSCLSEVGKRNVYIDWLRALGVYSFNVGGYQRW